MDELKSAIKQMVSAAGKRMAGTNKLEDAALHGMLVNNMLRQIRDGFFGCDRACLAEALKKGNINLAPDGVWRLAYVTAELSSALRSGWERNQLTDGFRSLAAELIAGKEGLPFTLTDVGGKFVTLTCFIRAADVSDAGLTAKCRHFNKTCLEALGLSPVCLISEAVELYDVAGLAPLMQNRLTRLRYQAGRVYMLNERESIRQTGFTCLDYDRVLRCVHQSNKAEYSEQVVAALNKIIHSRDSDVDLILKMHQELLQVFYDCLRDNGIPINLLINESSTGSLDLGVDWSLADFIDYTRALFDRSVALMHNANDEDIIKSAKQYIAKHFREDIDRNDVAAVTYITPNYLSKKFHLETGMNMREYINQLRVNEAKRLLLSTNLPISEVAGEIGYDNISYFSTVFKKLCGVSPIEWREMPHKEDNL
jgi:two-component system response regulator YesN